MNKTVVTVAFFVLALVSVAGAALMLILAPAGIDRFISTVVTILAIATTSAATIYGLGKQGEVIQQIKNQTNGSTSRMQDQIDAQAAQMELLHSLLAQSAALPDPATSNVAGSGNFVGTGAHS